MEITRNYYINPLVVNYVALPFYHWHADWFNYQCSRFYLYGGLKKAA
ncbi:hypothetical protein [uncultured Acinetobacter sp.]